MAKVNSTTKGNKKELKHKIEAALDKMMADMLEGKEISKHLHKKIKKAGKLLAEGLTEDKQPQEKEPVKKAAKAAAKEALPKKAVAKKAIVKKAAGKKAAKK